MSNEVLNVKINNADLAKALKRREGDIVNVKCKNGVPVDKYWRNRLKDMAVDNSVEIIKKQSKSKKEAD